MLRLQASIWQHYHSVKAQGLLAYLALEADRPHPPRPIGRFVLARRSRKVGA